MRILLLAAAMGLTACAATPPAIENVTPYKVAAGDDALALRATPAREVVTEIYNWVQGREASEIEARLRTEITGKTHRLYNPDDGVGVKYVGQTDVYYWSATTKTVRRGTWAMQTNKFGPQICETFYGQIACLNTVQQLAGVGVIDSREGDVFKLAIGGRPEVGAQGLPEW